MDKVLPHNLNSEKIVLASILSDVNAFAEVEPILRPEMFYDDFHKEMYKIIVGYAKSGKAPDIVLLSENYKNNPTGMERMIDISGHYSIDYYDHALNIQEKFVRRTLWKIGTQLSADVFSQAKETTELLAGLDKSLSEIDQSVTGSEVFTLKDAIKSVYNQIETNLKGEYITGTNTGFSKINKASGGLQKSDLIIIAGETSQGKALPMDACILTPDGWVKNRDLKIGQDVCSIDGGKSTITGIFYQGVRPMYEITFSDGRKVKCSDEHLWEVDSVSFKSGIRILNTLQIKKMQNESVAFKNRMSVPRFSGVFGDRRNFIMHPYILGVLIGDGCLTRGASWAKPDGFILQKITTLIPDECYIHTTGRGNDCPTHRISTVRGKGNPILDELGRLGLKGCLSGEKFIPEEYLNSCREQRIELLNGLMDTDGYIDTNGGCYYYTKSERLANDVRYLCHSLGYRASLNVKRAKINGIDHGDFYSVVICADDDREIFTTPNKRERARRRDRSKIIIRDIKYVGDEECQCISVSHDRELYVTDGFIMTHNTSLALSIVDTAAKSGCGVAVYSMEMKKEQCAARLISMNSGVPSNEILFSKLDENYIQVVDSGVNKIYDLPIYFDDNSTSNIDKIIASIRSMKAKHDIAGAVVDYLQILNVNQKAQNKEQAMGDVARRLKNLAKDLDIWIIALSQLNRDMQNPIPNLNRLRDSGQIAEAADIVMFVYRPEVYGKYYPEPFANQSTQGTAMIDIAKGRNIGLLKFICSFDAKTTHFRELNQSVTVDAYEDMPF